MMNIGSENNYSEKTVSHGVNEAVALIPVHNRIEKNKFTERVERYTKRFVDILGGIVGVAMLVPLTIVLYIVNKISKDDGPLFYTQERIGKDGKPFKIYKYRSMVVEADKKLKEYLEHNEEARKEYKQNKKLRNDPRVTKVGAIIRKTSIDEFPQFINVLKGDMSIVGPRPYLPREKEDMGSFYTCITKCKPGITGLWQVSGRSEVNFEARLNMDLLYYNEKNLKSDIKIILKTVKKILKKEGAM